MSEYYHIGLLKEHRFDPKRKITEDLAAWAHNVKFDDLPPDLVDYAKFLTVDFLASAIPGVSQEGPKVILNFIKSLNYHGPCTVIGTTIKTGPQYAALSSGASTGPYSLDASHRWSMPGHNSLSTTAAALAMSQVIGIGFREYVTALAVGCELEAKINMCLNPGVGCVDNQVGSAVATAGMVAKMIGLDQQGIQDAIALGSYQAAGGFEYDGPGYWSRRNHYGWLATQGIHAALLAKAGHRGSPNELEGGYGFINKFSSRPNVAVFDRMGNPWELPRNGIKRWEAMRYSHSSIDAIVDICTTNDLKPEQINEIILEQCSQIHSDAALPENEKRNPQIPMQGKLSAFWIAAAAAVHRRVWLTEYEDSVFFSSQIREMMDRVKCISNPEFDKDFPEKYTCVTTITTIDGQVFKQQVDYPKGERENPMTWDEMVEKFRAIYRDGDGADVMSMERHEEILYRVRSMENEGDIGMLVELMSSDKGYDG